MSTHLYRPAYATRLGNLAAKSVLVLLCEEANDEGMGWPSVDRIVQKTEISRRTVLRVLEVFAAIELIERKKTMIQDRFGSRIVDAIFVNLGMLEKDLTERFAARYAQAQGKECLRDIEIDVSETRSDVSETLFSVSETQPPHPLIGVPAIDPLPDPTDAAFSPEQQEHLDRLTSEGRSTREWEAYYRDEAARATRSLGSAALDGASDRELARECPTAELAIAKLRKRCGFALARASDELGEELAQVFRDQAEMGKPPWRVGAQMEAAWLLQREQGPRLRARFGPVKFFRDGHWLDPAGWHWNTEILEQETRAGIGSR